MILRVGFPKWLTDRWWLLKNWEHLFFWVCLLNQFGKILMKMLLLWMHWLLPHVSCVIVKKRFPVVSAFDTVAFPVIYLDSLDYSFCSFWCWVCVIFLQMLWLEKLNKETSLWCFWVLFGCIYGMRNSFSYEVIIAVQGMAIWIWRDDALRFSLRDEFYMSWEFCWSSVLVISWPWIRNNLELQRD